MLYDNVLDYAYKHESKANVSESPDCTEYPISKSRLIPDETVPEFTPRAIDIGISRLDW